MPKRASVLMCKDCRYWYGAEDEGFGPCSLKNMRGERKYLTWGSHVCDERAALKEIESSNEVEA